MPEEELENEIQEIIRENIPPVVFPDIQKVEVINFPEEKEPVINVTVPEIKVPTPQVTINPPEVTVEAPVINVEKPDLSILQVAIKALESRLEQLLNKKAPEIDYKKLDEIQGKHAYKGGGIGPSKVYNTLLNTAKTAINPATEDKQDDIITALGAIPQFTIQNAITATAYDLNAAPYSASSNITTDYILDHIQFNFSSSQSRTITVTAADGTVLWTETGNTNTNLVLNDINSAFNANDNFTIAITQTGGACTVDVLATIKTGTASLAGNPTVVNAGDSTVSSANSTTTLLTNGQTFTGTWEDVSAYQSLVVAVKTDQNGYYTIQYSPDGTNADSTLTRYYRTTQIEAPHRFTNTRKYARVTFTNDSGSDQTYLRLQTMYGDKQQLNIPIDATMAQDYDSLSVRPTDFKYEVALGRRQGATTWNKFGYNDDVDIGTEVVAAFGGTFTPLTSASTLTIVSSSTDDDGSPAGIGANSVVIYGIDANRKSQTEVVTLNGTTNVVTATSWLGVNRVAIYLAGSSLSNVGNITVTATTGGATQAYMPAGQGTTQQLIFFTQADHQALADWMVLNAEKLTGGTTPKVIFKGWVFSAVSNAKYEVFRQVIDTSVDDHIELKPTQPFVIGEKSCFWIEATTDQNNTITEGRFSLIEFRDIDA